MSYNVQNLFDDVRDGTEYSEFDPGGRSWSGELYRQKLAALSRVIRAAIPRGADLLALQEVENLNTLEDLRRELAGMGYRVAIMVPVPGSAINVGFLSRHPVTRVNAHQLQYDGEYPLRNILEIQLDVRGRTLYVFNNHWKSKSGDPAGTETARLEAASRLNGRIGEILAVEPAADIIVAGDLNETCAEYSDTGRAYRTALMPAGEVPPGDNAGSSLFLSAEPVECGMPGESLMLYEPWYQIPPAERGSYYYQGNWESIDHLLASCGLFDAQGFSYAAFRVVRKPFMLHSRTGAPLGWRNDGSGFSDHLPLILELTIH